MSYTQHSPEQRPEVPHPIGARLRTTDFAQLFIDTALNYYGNAVPKEATSHMVVKQTVAREVDDPSQPDTSNVVQIAPSRMAAHQPGQPISPELSQEERIAAARENLNAAA